ncbi:hypothetical protein [Sphingobacterium hotanense]|uniref:Uncharacterized protein n=1 Tax=Sphingobacterium hotanense TaxID=649196 RepID=A0ABT7NQG3_9SPHI|nr:hypothetical protein [Sphingobacterium hotanense]MDM1049487.1 hypothetical protein [Sphingobacterium hotanense]
MTVFIKRYPSKGELPQFKDGVYQGYFHTEFGLVKYSKYDGWKLARKYPDYFLEEIELPSEEWFIKEVEKLTNHSLNKEWRYTVSMGYLACANFILNHLKSNTNG